MGRGVPDRNKDLDPRLATVVGFFVSAARPEREADETVL
jgi:hypothetical protein